MKLGIFLVTLHHQSPIENMFFAESGNGDRGTALSGFSKKEQARKKDSKTECNKLF